MLKTGYRVERNNVRNAKYSVTGFVAVAGGIMAFDA